MTWLLDVNVLLACGWKTHPQHIEVLTWLGGIKDWATSPITELGFLRVSMSPAYQASYADAQIALQSLCSRGGHSFIADDVPARDMAPVAHHKFTTDAYLAGLAQRHGRKLATLDQQLICQPWARQVALNPLVAHGDL